MPLLSPDPQLKVLVTSWQTGWVGLLAMAFEVAALAWYLSTLRRLARTGRHWSPYTALSFVIGLAVVAYAYEGGVAHYERLNFTAHSVQLLLLVMVAPALLAGGSPLRLALLTSHGRPATALVRALRSDLAKLMTHPLTGFIVAMATMYVYFLTPLYGFSERHPVFLAYVHLQFLVSGCLMWWPVTGRDVLPRPAGFVWRFAVVVATVPVVGYLGIELASLSSPLYPAANTLRDTHQGGNILWSLVIVFVVAAAGYLFVEWAREEQRRVVQADRQLDAALAAARSVMPLEEDQPGQPVL
jgi:cytochrome c oxidase assembly factor CtaG